VTPLVTLHRVVQAQTKIDCVTTKGKHFTSSPGWARQRYALSLTSPCVVIMMFALCRTKNKKTKINQLRLRSWLGAKGGGYLQIPVNELVLMQVEDPLEHLDMWSSNDNMGERGNEC
jgi:hypothetical protein